MSQKKENILSAALGLLLACLIGGYAILISVKKDRDVLRQVLVVTRANEDRVGEVLEIQREMTGIMRSVLEVLSRDLMSEDKLAQLRSCQSQIENLADRQLLLMHEVTAQRLPSAPVRIWASRRLRDRYFSKRAELAVLQDSIRPIIISAGYLRSALERKNG